MKISFAEIMDVILLCCVDFFYPGLSTKKKYERLCSMFDILNMLCNKVDQLRFSPERFLSESFSLYLWIHHDQDVDFCAQTYVGPL